MLQNSADAIKRIGFPGALALISICAHTILFGAIAALVLWPDRFEKFEVLKLVYFSTILTLPFVTLGVVVIMLGAMDRRPIEHELRYSMFVATLFVAICQGAALLHMFFNKSYSKEEWFFWSLIGSLLCIAPAMAKRHESEEDERDFREGIRGKKSFFRGKRKGGE